MTEEHYTDPTAVASEFALNSTLEAAQMASWSWDEVAKVRIWTAKTKAVFGFAPDAVVTKETFLKCLHPDDIPRYKAAWAAALDPKGTRIFQLKYRIRRVSDQGERWISSRGVVDFSGDQPVKVLGVLHDITNEKKTSDERDYRDQLNQISFDLAPTGMMHLNSEGVFLKVNAAMAEITGYNADEMIGMKISQLTFAADQISDSEQLNLFLAGILPEYSSEKRYLRKDGSLRWVAVNARMIFDACGKPVHTIGVVRDISKRKAAQQRSLESEAKLLLGVSVAGIGLGVIDYEADTIVLDEVAAKLFDLPSGMAIARGDVHARFHRDDCDEIFARMEESFDPARNGFMSVEHRIVRADGSVRWVSARKQIQFSEPPALETKRPTSGLLAVVDVSARKNDEASLKEREERLRLILDGTLAFIGVLDPDGTLLEANSAALSAGGLNREEQVGRKVWDCDWFSSDPFEVARLRDAVARSALGEIVRYDANVRMKDDEQITIDFMMSPVKNNLGQVQLLVPSGFDITDRIRSETALRRSHDTYLNLIQNNPFGVYLIDSGFRMVQLSAGAHKAFAGVHPLIGRDFAEILLIVWQEPLASELIARFRNTLETGTPYHSADTTESRGDRGVVESYDWQIERVTLPDGRFGVVCYFYDITERKRYEQHIRLLMGEVNHRSRNLLGVVQAIARQTGRNSDPATFTQRLSERIGALAHNQELLVKSNWQGVEVADLTRMQLSHLEDLFDKRIFIVGPAAMLTASAAQGVGMALHELATNAVKYGSLSNGTGRVHINWSIGRVDEQIFCMQWDEVDGPEVIAPTRTGFGKTVIGPMMEAAVDGKVKMTYSANGFVWKLTAPYSKTLEAVEERALK